MPTSQPREVTPTAAGREAQWDAERWREMERENRELRTRVSELELVNEMFRERVRDMEREARELKARLATTGSPGKRRCEDDEARQDEEGRKRVRVEDIVGGSSTA